MKNFLADLRFAIRRLARDPLYTGFAIAMLALGIGSTTTIFSMVNGILLQPLRYRQPQQLHLIREVVPMMGQMGGTWPANLRHFDTWRKNARSFDQIAVAEPMAADLTSLGEAQEIYGARVSANLFDLLGVSPQRGRTFLPQEENPGHDQVVIITDSFWRNELQSDPLVIGRSLTLNGVPAQIIGVLPESFRFPQNDQLGARVQFTPRTVFFKPLGIDLNTVLPLGNFRFAALARLKPGVTPEQALRDLNTVQGQISSDLAKDGGRRIELSATLTALSTQIVGPSRSGLLFLLAASATALLIVCVNLAGLSLVKASRSAREAAIRISLGASRKHLLSQVLAETIPLSLLGGTLGLLLAYVGLKWLALSAPVDLPRLDELRIDTPALLFCTLLSVASGILFGLLPARYVSGLDPQDTLRSGGTTMTSDRAGRSLRAALVVLEVALTLLLVVMAGVLTNSLVRVLRLERGFDSNRVITFEVALPPQRYMNPPDRLQFYDSARRAVAGLPSVQSAGWISKLPLEGQTFIAVVNVPGLVQQDYSKLMANFRFGSPDYFQSIGIRLQRGRVFDETDRSKNVAVISQAVASSVWPLQDPIGQHFHPGSNDSPLTEVIGIVADVRTVRLDETPLPIVYLPYWELQTPATASLVVRTQRPTLSLPADVRQVIRGIDPLVPIVKVRAMDQIVADSIALRRFQSGLARVFALFALLLAALGVFSVVSYSVNQRRQELGIRLALGATAPNLRNLVLLDGMKPVAAGTLLGVLAAFPAGKALNSLFFGASSAGFLPLALGIGIVLAVGLFACSLPLARMNKTDLVRNLRLE